MKNLIIAIALFICFIYSSAYAQETMRFTDGGYLYADDLKEIIGSKKIKEWKQKNDTLVTIEEFKRTLALKGVYVMPNYVQETVEGFLVEEFGSRLFLIMNENVSYFPYLLYKSSDEYGYSSWNRMVLNDGIPVNLLSRIVVAGRAR
ncbi:hypothetical protein IPN41_02170 [Candidatus Falkowbacteria bacterium]|nr:MAG: hypothetical protein IPN41_02170 [Candidatus Falkowbacteria bacterium]